MPQNMFKIYDGRTNFWQWDVQQKLIVLDESVDEVHFSHQNMNYSISREVYVNKDKLRVCNVPNDLLSLPRNLVVHAYSNGTTLKTVKFAVVKRPMPNDYVIDYNEEIDNKLTQITDMIEDIAENKADNIQYNEDGQYIQLISNGKPIGDSVEIPDADAPGEANSWGEF